MYLNIHDMRSGRIVAVCDENLIGKTFLEGEAVLDLKKHSGFYKGKKASKDEVVIALKSFTSANLVGQESVSVAISMGIISEDNIQYIEEIPHVQIYNI